MANPFLAQDLGPGVSLQSMGYTTEGAFPPGKDDRIKEVRREIMHATLVDLFLVREREPEPERRSKPLHKIDRPLGKVLMRMDARAKKAIIFARIEALEAELATLRTAHE